MPKRDSSMTRRKFVVGAAVTGAAAYNATQALSGSDKRIDSDEVRAKLHQVNEAIDGAAKTAAAAVAEPIKELGTGVAKAGQATVQLAQGIQQRAKQIKENVKQKILSTEAGEFIAEAYNTRDQAPVVLSPSKTIDAVGNTVDVLTTPFQLALNWHKTVQKLANNKEKIKQKAKSMKQGIENTAQALNEGDYKVILKKSGQVVLRTAFRSMSETKKDITKTSKKTAEGSASILGGILKDFGHQMADNSAHASGQNRKFDFKDWIHADEQSDEFKEKMEEASKAEFFRQMGDD